MAVRLLRWLSVFVIVACVMSADTVSAYQRSPSDSITIVASYWRYEYSSGSTYPHRVHVAAEIRNSSTQYLGDVAVRVRLRSASGTEIASITDNPLKTALAPGESTFFTSIIFDDDVFLTTSADFQAFGDPISSGLYPYLPDPSPLYLRSGVSGGYVNYFGEIENTTGQTWKSTCTLCDATNLLGVYYENGQITDWSYLSVSPDGHLPPNSRVAFRFGFQRVPSGSFKLFSRVEPLPTGSYPTTWSVENLQWALTTSPYGSPQVEITARIRNTSDVPAKPNVWFVGRNAADEWIGWVGCFIWDNIAPGGYVDCAEEILSIFMHVGTPSDIRSVEALIASSNVSSQPPPTPTPTTTPTSTPSPTATATPTFTSTPTPLPSATPTATPTATWTPIPDWWQRLYLPMILR